jgi:hypothetical protein
MTKKTNKKALPEGSTTKTNYILNEVTWKVKGLFKADAATVYSEIKTLGDAFTPEMVVDAARDESTELHKCFTWDDTAAAEKYRRHEARILMASIVVKTVTTDNTPVSVRVISSTETRNEYKPTVMLIESEQEYADLLARAIRELKAFQIKYKAVEELREIFDAIYELQIG